MALAVVTVMIDSAHQLIKNLDKLHTTKLGRDRIRHNLSLINGDIIDYCKKKILNLQAIIKRKGKNWYVKIAAITITIHDK